jgi:hypothetical protein
LKKRHRNTYDVAMPATITITIECNYLSVSVILLRCSAIIDDTIPTWKRRGKDEKKKRKRGEKEERMRS